ncbi:MAG: hypothetical protein KatS3mg129_0159 [Leptospiraceae bacterium]|nr:MAG: hypothetical protein KatS3mg129_0159 [Leptospiraceae bacterium]
MWNKENFNDYAIHLYAIAEGTGHIQRIFHIAEYLSKFYKNILVFIWNIHNHTFIENYIRKMNFRQSYFIFHSFNEIQLKNNKTNYFIIMDIRDYDPDIIKKVYKKNKSYILSIDNYNKNKYNDINYWYTLPHPKMELPIKESLKKNFWNPAFIQYLLNNSNCINKNQFILVYLGLHNDNTYKKILDKKLKVKQILQSLEIIKKNENVNIITIDNKTFYSPEEFYKIFNSIDIVITYPGILFYEAMLLNKIIIAYHFNSLIHSKILDKIRKEFSDYYNQTLLINHKINSYEFFYFDFKMFKEIELNNFNLWTPYQNLKNWIEKYISD